MRIWMRDIRKMKGYSQQKAAQLSGISSSFYADIERDERDPSPHNAQAIGNALGFDWTLFYTKNLRISSRNAAKQTS